MSKPGRIWFPLDANFTRDAAVIRAGERAGWLYLALLGQVKLTGAAGYLGVDEVARLGISSPRPRLAALIDAGLVKPDGSELWLPAWESWQVNSRAAYMREWRRRGNDPPDDDQA